MTVPLSAPWQTLLAHPGPESHLVQLYQDDAFFGEAVSHFVAQGVAQGDAVIVVATAPHWDLLADCLADKGLDVVALRRYGQLLLLDADATLPTFLVGTWPDAPTFKALARAIAQARGGSRVRPRPLVGRDGQCAVRQRQRPKLDAPGRTLRRSGP